MGFSASNLGATSASTQRKAYGTGSRQMYITNIREMSSTYARYFSFYVKSGANVGDTVTVYANNLFDLTQLFGSGNEPSTVEEFESWLVNNIGYRDYYAYNPGEIISNNTEKLEVYDTDSTLISELDLNLASITGKLNGEGESVTIFPDGMRSAGTAHDSLIVDEDGWCRKAVRRMTEVNLGDQSWGYSGERFRSEIADLPQDRNSALLCPKYIRTTASTNAEDKTIYHGAYYGRVRVAIKDTAYTDAATFKTAMSGVPLIYELDTPLEYELDTPIFMGIKTQQGGVIRQLPENGSAPTTAPMRMDITYALSPEALISGSSLENLLKALKSANKISDYMMTYNATSGKWEFSIS